LRTYILLCQYYIESVTNKVNERYAVESYNPEEFKEELFKDCPMNIALSLGFFLTLGERLAKISHRFFAEKRERNNKRRNNAK
jgi:hypothetical protein